ncbi:hypothetical protein [Cellulomonas marina]|uniref:Uncharacterized protein n=1 Tax=Cellulomonas marina TaxID=988821 RepID=A0A1I1A3J1_9CELL|nr:hypothetical protein [Cellulomonas marina]GIG30473.1 hypothetical protein Cma02nite_30730 [Cellulomonas marina]SFB32072.1 hypothetical protein SAMN05421867_11471 [Cellulomonas marina]
MENMTDLVGVTPRGAHLLAPIGGAFQGTGLPVVSGGRAIGSGLGAGLGTGARTGAPVGGTGRIRTTGGYAPVTWKTSHLVVDTTPRTRSV